MNLAQKHQNFKNSPFISQSNIGHQGVRLFSSQIIKRTKVNTRCKQKEVTALHRAEELT